MRKIGPTTTKKIPQHIYFLLRLADVLTLKTLQKLRKIYIKPTLNEDLCETPSTLFPGLLFAFENTEGREEERPWRRLLKSP